MSERYTSIEPRERSNTPVGIGLNGYGRKTRAEMIEAYRRYYQAQFETAQAALKLEDDELIVETFTGLWSQRGKTEVVDKPDEP